MKQKPSTSQEQILPFNYNSENNIYFLNNIANKQLVYLIWIIKEDISL